MMGKQEAVVLEVTPLAIHGQPYVDVTLGFPDRTTDRSRLGPESVPDGLQAGERVLATRVAAVVVSIRRP
ncbi:MAG TPA: hypothetical protein VFQ40_02540 [Actinomycetota bacterium]|nr:hypothetical protein [Actinomycetota bacterium]